jgi:intracellular sulfur oxidation DsrE/DsrF family protein
MLKRTMRGLSREMVMTLAFGLVVGGAMAATLPTGDVEARGAGEAAASQHDKWLTELDGEYQQLFDAASPNGGLPMVHLMNYYDTYNSAYNVTDEKIDGILTFYGATTFHGLNDAMWAKYDLGSYVGEVDAAGKGFDHNPWRTSVVALGMELPQASIEAMQKRGATFIVCNNALGIFANIVAKKLGLDGDAVYADFKANILPGVTLVPGMVIAIDKAQRAGISYHKQ